MKNTYRFILWPLLFFLSSWTFSETPHYPRGTHDIFIAKTKKLRPSLLKNIAPILERSIAKGYYPGAVILITHKGQLVYRGVFGNKRIEPKIAPMQSDTLFDIASLTKVVATTPAIMQLIEQGKLELDAPVAHYWPSFAKQNKEKITIRELLTHTSGLPAEISLKKTDGEKELLEKITLLKPHAKPGVELIYSDVNFIVLAHLVKLISKEPINQYATRHIFKPLNMQTTFFLPANKYHSRIAPTERINGQLRDGKVHDPIAYQVGGVAGHAGLFSTANDLQKFTQAILNQGKLPRIYKTKKEALTHFLGPLTIAKMISPQTPKHLIATRGLGWDIDSAYSARGELLPTRSFGHTGWTGTSLWIDPVTQTTIILLTSRAHPKPAQHHQLVQDRRTIANIVSASIIDIKNFPNNTSQGEMGRAFFKR